MEESEHTDVVGSSVVNSPNVTAYRWLPDFSWVKSDRVSLGEKSITELETANTELTLNYGIQDSGFEVSFSPVIPHNVFAITRVELVDVNSENNPVLFKNGNGKMQNLNDIEKAGVDDNKDYNDNTQNGDCNNGDNFDKGTSIHDIKDGDDDTCSTTSEILISVNDLRCCTLFEAADAKELSRSNAPSPNTGNREEVISTKSMELLDNCTAGSTQDESDSYWPQVANQVTGNHSLVDNRAGVFSTPSDFEITEEPFSVSIDFQTDLGPTAVVSSALERPVVIVNEDAGLIPAHDGTISITATVRMADDAEISAEPITISDDEELVEITMTNDNGIVEKTMAMVIEDVALNDGEYSEGPFAKATTSVIAGDHLLTTELIHSVVTNETKLAGKDSQRVSQLTKTAEDNEIATGHCGLQNGKNASRFAEMEMEISAELEASSLEDLEAQHTESSIDHNHRKEMEKILKAERLLFTAQQGLENDFQGYCSVFELLNDVQKLLFELHASQSVETQSLAKRMELLGKCKEDRAILLYEGKLLRIRRRRLLMLSESHQLLYEKAVSLSAQSDTESENRIVCNYSTFSTARKPQEITNLIIDDETRVERNFSLKESNHKKMLDGAPSCRKTVRFALPDSVETASQAGRFNVEEKDTCQQSQKISAGGNRLLLHNENDHRLVPVDCSLGTSSIPISDSVTEPQILSNTNSNRKATGNYGLKRPTGLAPSVTASKVSKSSGSESNATQANVCTSTFMKKFSENINLQTSKISPDFAISAPFEKFSLVSTSFVNPGCAETVFNSVPSSNNSIYGCIMATPAVMFMSDSSNASSRKPVMPTYRSEVSVPTASLKPSTVTFTSEASDICSRKLDVLKHKLPVSVTAISSNRQSAAPQINVNQNITPAPCLLLAHTVTAPSQMLHSPITFSVISCSSSLAVNYKNYQQANCRAFATPLLGVSNVTQSLCHPLSSTSVLNSNMKQQMHMKPDNVLQNCHSSSHIFNMKDCHTMDYNTSKGVSTPAGCHLISQSRNSLTKTSLKHLIDDKLIQPGVNVLSARNQHGQVFASITPSGNIKNEKGQIFKSLRAWYLNAVELATVSLATIHRQVLYYGVPIETVVSGSKDLENASQDSPADECLLINSSKGSLAEQDEDFLLKTISKIAFLHLHSEAELEPCDKWVWSSHPTLCSPSWLETIDDWK